jgi:hypothetical protein
MNITTLTAAQITTLLTLRDATVRLASKLPVRIRDTHTDGVYSNIFEVAVEGRICGYIHTAGNNGSVRAQNIIANYDNAFDASVESRISGYTHTAGNNGSVRTRNLIVNESNIVQTNELIVDNKTAFFNYLVAVTVALDTNAPLTQDALNDQDAFTQEARTRAEERSIAMFGIL